MTKYTLQPPQTPWHRDTLFKQSVIHMTRLQAARSYQRGTTIRSTVMNLFQNTPAHMVPMLQSAVATVHKLPLGVSIQIYDATSK